MRLRHPPRPLLALSLGFLAFACSDLMVDPAPVPHALALSLGLAPGLAPSASIATAFDRSDRVRVRVSQGETAVKDTTVGFSAGEADARVRIALDAVLAQEPLAVRVELLRGAEPLFESASTVTLEATGVTTIETAFTPIVARVRVPESVDPLTALGSTAQLAGAALFATGDTIPDVALSWRALDPGVVEVSGAGGLVARAEGQARVEGSLGSLSDTVAVLVRAVVTRVVVAPSALPVLVGGTVQPGVVVEDANGNALSGRAVEWSTSDASVAEVGPDGVVRGVSAGEAVVTAVAEDVSGTATVSVANPQPTLLQLSPAAATVGGGATEIVATGGGFVPGSTATWNGESRPTEFVGPGELRFDVTAADLAQVGSAAVAVTTPAPGGGVSSPLDFAVLPDAPAIHGLEPSIVPVGSGATTLTVTGRGFVPGSVVRWAGADRATQFVGAATLRAAIPASDLATARTVPVTVFTPEPGGGTSVASTFTVANPLPAIARVDPDSVEAGSGAFTLTVDGQNLVPGTVVRWAGETRPTTFLSATRVEASIPAADVAGAGTFAVTLFTPGPGGGASAARPVVVAATPRLQLSTHEVTFRAGLYGSPPPSQDVVVTNGGGGTLEDIFVDVDQHDDVAPWITAEHGPGPAPFTVTLEVDQDSLPVGTYTATVYVGSESAPNSTDSVHVSLVVADLFSFWRADGDYQDGGPAGNHGTPTGSVRLSPDGIVGGAFEFHGPFVAEEIRAPEEGGGIGTATSVTLAAWVNLDSLETGTGVRRFVTLGPERAVLRLDGQFGGEGGGDDSLHFYLSTGDGDGVGIYVDGALWQRRCWYHVAATYDGSMARVYLNGDEVEDAVHFGVLTPGDGSGITLSNADAGGLENLHGLLDEVRVLPRAASAGEIRDWAGLDVGGVCPTGT